MPSVRRLVRITAARHMRATLLHFLSGSSASLLFPVPSKNTDRWTMSEQSWNGPGAQGPTSLFAAPEDSTASLAVRHSPSGVVQRPAFAQLREVLLRDELRRVVVVDVNTQE